MRAKAVLWSLLVAAGNACAAPALLAQLTAGPNAVRDAFYGSSLASDDVRIAIGEPSGFSGGSPVTYLGAVEIWRQDGTTMVFEQRIASPGPDVHEFGTRVAISGDWLAACGFATGQAQRVHLYHRKEEDASWSLQQTLSSESWAPFAILDDRLVVGAPGEGAVHTYRRTGGAWLEQPALTSNDPSELFGYAVAMDRGVDGALELAVGAPGFPEIQMFRDDGSGWVEEQRLRDSQTSAGYGFGMSIALRGNTLTAGIHQEMVGPYASAGAVAVWHRVGVGMRWMVEARLVHPAAYLGDNFGFAVAVPSEGEVLVSTPWRLGKYYDEGEVRRFVLEKDAATCARSWHDAGAVGNAGILPQDLVHYGSALSNGRLIGIGASGAMVQSMYQAGAVDVLYDDGIFSDAFDCG